MAPKKMRKKKRGCSTKIDIIPDELFVDIIGFLYTKELLVLSEVSRRFNTICNSDFVWKEKMFGVDSRHQGLIAFITGDYYKMNRFSKEEFIKVYRIAVKLKYIFDMPNFLPLSSLIRDIQKCLTSGNTPKLKIPWLKEFIVRCSISVKTKAKIPGGFDVDKPVKWVTVNFNQVIEWHKSNLWLNRIHCLCLNGLIKFVKHFLSSRNFYNEDQATVHLFHVFDPPIQEFFKRNHV